MIFPCKKDPIKSSTLHLEARDKDREGGGGRGAVPRRLAMLTARRGQVRMERKRWELGRISWEATKSGEKWTSAVYHVFLAFSVG